MKIAACLGVKDDNEMLGPAIAHLRAIGVSRIFAWDAGSTDGSYETLLHEQQADLEIFRYDDTDNDMTEWHALMARIIRTAESEGCDWILFQDADEFWLPETGRLDASLSDTKVDVLNVTRLNVPLKDGAANASFPLIPAAYDDLMLFARADPGFRDTLINDPRAAWVRMVPLPKIIARPKSIDTTSLGNHFHVARAGIAPSERTPRNLVIAHFPFTTPERFHRKMVNMRVFLENHPTSFDGDTAWHWKRWIANASDDEFEAEFGRNDLDAATFARLRDNGTIASATEWFSTAGADTRPLWRRLLSKARVPRIGPLSK